MSGYKNVTQVFSTESTRGHYDPQVSDINFAVPSVEMLRKHSLHGDEDKYPRLPGIYSNVMQITVADNIKGTSACLSYDAKKLKQGFSSDFGDIDLLDFED